uniref:Uncharacterized protein n=1 Tax=Clytia hemisphaerica TaxID=252671 RepID=A0A7M5XJW5_9CNID
LGIVFDEGMTWEKHANAVRQKAYLGLNKIKRGSSTLNDDERRLLVNALVLPHLNYCMNTWRNTSSYVRKRFESLSRQINLVSQTNKSFEKMTNYSTALLSFKSVNKISPAYLTKRFVLCGNRNEKGELVGVNTRAARENKLCVQKTRNKYDSKHFFVM